MNNNMMREYYIAELEQQVKKLKIELENERKATDWLRNEMIQAASLLSNTEYEINTNWEARYLLKDTLSALEKIKQMRLALEWYQEHAQALIAIFTTLKLDNGSRAAQALGNSRPQNKAPAPTPDDTSPRDP